MKKIIVSIIMLISNLSFASSINCTTKPYEDNSGVGVIAHLEAKCSNWDNGDQYEVTIKSRGPSLRVAAFQSFILECPFRSGKEVNGEYTGMKVEAEVLVGLKGGLFYTKDKACILGGIQGGGVGIGLTGGTLTIKRTRSNDDEKEATEVLSTITSKTKDESTKILDDSRNKINKALPAANKNAADKTSGSSK